MAFGLELTVAAGDADAAVIEGTEVGDADVSGKYEMPAEAVTLSKAWKVTLNGFTSVKTSDNAMTVTDGSYVADGKSLDYTTLPADKHVINTTDGSVAKDAVLTSNVTVSADVELSATQVEITSNIAKIEYVRSGSGRTSEITDTNSDDKVYVLAGETLVVTGTTPLLASVSS